MVSLFRDGRGFSCGSFSEKVDIIHSEEEALHIPVWLFLNVSKASFDGYARIVRGKGLLAFVFGCFEGGPDGKDGECMVRLVMQRIVLSSMFEHRNKFG